MNTCTNWLVNSLVLVTCSVLEQQRCSPFLPGQTAVCVKCLSFFKNTIVLVFSIFKNNLVIDSSPNFYP